MPRDHWNRVAGVAGALGLLVGIGVPLIGTAAAVGLVLFFVAAIITHLRARKGHRRGCRQRQGAAAQGGEGGEGAQAELKCKNVLHLADAYARLANKSDSATKSTEIELSRGSLNKRSEQFSRHLLTRFEPRMLYGI